ncbi:UNVERIFIED_CONTAM: Peptide-N4-(N-acetyl-beta-glucosaminyl)asparagine amidase A [Sesamum radiatum]|uniref:Uroporphyrinogen decarboxylase n=1 Tax=Sesamum radiatum TaxID=300843 RepID=A0AAW2LN63_SESRA
MAPSQLFSLLLLLGLSFLQPLLSAAHLRQTTSLLRSHPISEHASLYSAAEAAPPTTYFEVTRPIPLPRTRPCSYSVLQHDFASTYGMPPVLANYKPPSDCPSQDFARIVLEWTATCKGRQFDRIFGVWLGGVEILRSCTAEPRATGIVWTVKKDITRYYSLLMEEQTMAVYLGNIIDSTYTGIYHVTVKIHFYPAEENHGRSGIVSGADLILPISRNLPLNDGLWFEIQNSTSVEGKEFKIPQNAYRAVLEVYVSFHENDEFWYANYPNDYISVNNLTGMPGNGPFREVVVTLDGMIVGAVWPFTVIFTGGINPLFWRPITGIGSFDLPTYDIEITPFLGKLLDGKSHRLAFSVTNALNVWYIDANLHLWLDKKNVKTQGKLLKHSSSPLSLSLQSNVAGSDGSFVANASRSVTSSGWVKSSRGVITTKSRQEFKYSNAMKLGKDGNLQILNQRIHFKGSLGSKTPSSSVGSSKLFRNFGLYMYSDNDEKGNGSVESRANVAVDISEKGRTTSRYGSFLHRLKNTQNAHGYLVYKDKMISGWGKSKQDYHYSVGLGWKSSSLFTPLNFLPTGRSNGVAFSRKKAHKYTAPSASASSSDPLLVKAARGDPVNRPPAWMMRQAGRYMAVYRKLAEKYPSFRERSETTDLIVQISLQPWEAFRPDGVIIFSDILTPLPAFGVNFDIEEVRGPVIQSPIRSEEDLKTLHPIDFEKLQFVGESLQILRKQVGEQAAVLGFVGAPWTIATYIVEGGTTRTYTTIKSMCHTAPHLLRGLLSHLTKAIAEYIIFQVESGAHCIQIFDSWGGQLPPDMWDNWSKPYINEIVRVVKEKCPQTPLVLYINGNGGLLERMKGTGVDVIGLDWTVDMADGRRRLGTDISIQGNVDPAYLFSSLPAVTNEINRVVNCAGKKGHILNLGHGVLVGTPEEAVAHFFDVARSINFDSQVDIMPLGANLVA